jgi:hypothetical protein
MLEFGMYCRRIREFSLGAARGTNETPVMVFLSPNARDKHPKATSSLFL